MVVNTILFFPEKGCFGYNPQSKCIYWSKDLTWLVLMEWWKGGNDFYTVLIWVHTTYNMGKVRSMYLLYFFELKDICSSLPNAFLASRLNHECLYWTWSHCKKIYFIFSSLLRPMVYKRVLMALLHSRPEIPQCSTIWLRISNLKRIRLHTFFSTPDAVSSIWRICDKHIRL